MSTPSANCLMHDMPHRAGVVVASQPGNAGQKAFECPLHPHPDSAMHTCTLNIETDCIGIAGMDASVSWKLHPSVPPCQECTILVL